MLNAMAIACKVNSVFQLLFSLSPLVNLIGQKVVILVNCSLLGHAHINIVGVLQRCSVTYGITIKFGTTLQYYGGDFVC